MVEGWWSSCRGIAVVLPISLISREAAGSRAIFVLVDIRAFRILVTTHSKNVAPPAHFGEVHLTARFEPAITRLQKKSFELPEGLLAGKNALIRFIAMLSDETLPAEAVVSGLSSMRFDLKTPSYLQARLQHSQHPQATGRLAPRCTVRCSHSGEERTGQGVCIKCGSSYGTFEICC
jgi:hypothetical protein